MKCSVCGDHGLVRVWYGTLPVTPQTDWDIAVCLCLAGQQLRRTQNRRHTTVPLWQLWAARAQIPLDRMALIEDLYDAQELAQWFPRRPVQDEDAVIAAGQTRDRRR